MLQGGAEGELLARLKRDFAAVRHVKPKASRADSAELYRAGDGLQGRARLRAELRRRVCQNTCEFKSLGAKNCRLSPCHVVALATPKSPAALAEEPVKRASRRALVASEQSSRPFAFDKGRSG